MIIDIDEELKLSKLRKILKLISKPNRILKVSIDGEFYDISKIVDKKDIIIFEIENSKE